MGRNDIHYIPPMTFFGRELLVGYKSAGSRDVDSFDTINEAIEYIVALPSEEQPSAFSWFVIKLHPGIYPEKVILPKFCGLVGSAPAGCILVGETPVDPSNHLVLSTSIGFISNLTISPQKSGLGAVVLVRSATSLYTIHHDDFGVIGNGDTLHITSNVGDDTIVFTGTETTAVEVAATINAQSYLFTAKPICGQVEIYSTSYPGNPMTCKGDGTANNALGFPVGFDYTEEASVLEILLTTNILISGNSAGIGLYYTDKGGGNYTIYDILVAGCNEGVRIATKATLLGRLREPVMFFNTKGLVLEDDTEIVVFGGFAIGNTTDIVLGGADSRLDSRSFTYKTRSGVEGEVMPGGSRITFGFASSGTISVEEDVDGLRLLPFNSTIESVSISRSIAGNGGQTVVDVNQIVNGVKTSLYTTQANRPYVTTAQGDYAYNLAVLPDIMNLTQGYMISIDVDEKETVSPSGLYVTITLVVHGA